MSSSTCFVQMGFLCLVRRAWYILSCEKMSQVEKNGGHAAQDSVRNELVSLV